MVFAAELTNLSGIPFTIFVLQENLSVGGSSDLWYNLVVLANSRTADDSTNESSNTSGEMDDA